jgi:hypothetical protein
MAMIIGPIQADNPHIWNIRVSCRIHATGDSNVSEDCHRKASVSSIDVSVLFLLPTVGIMVLRSDLLATVKISELLHGKRKWVIMWRIRGDQ